MREKTKYNLTLVAYWVTVFTWGSGFVLQNKMLANGLSAMPSVINAVRFLTATLVCGIVFARKIRLNKTSLLYGALCGVGLFLGFFFQVKGLEHSTPANCSFFSTSYIIFVPFFTYLFFKKPTHKYGIAGIFVAMAGLLFLNMNAFAQPSSQEIVIGNLLTVCSAISFAYHMSMCDKALSKVNSESLIFVQVATACVCFVAYFFIQTFAVDKNTWQVFAEVNYSAVWWRLAIVALVGTGFAYIAQTKAQELISPTETALIMSTESVFGAVISIIVGLDRITWQLVVGGVLVVSSVLVAELLPFVVAKYKQKNGNAQ